MSKPSTLGLKRGTVQLVPHSPQWAELFEVEKQLLTKAFGDIIISIEHVGSTSIPGIPAKPIIDMNIGVASLEVAREMHDGFAELGYEYRPSVPGHTDDGLDLRELYVRGPESRRTHYAHVAVYESDFWSDVLLFRDHLRQNTERAQDYAELKTRLAQQFPNDRGAYTKGKELFVLLTLYVAELAGFLGNDLLGVYLYGSLARGCHNGTTSDVDMIIVVRGSCSGLDASRVLELHRNSAIPIDAKFVTEDQIHLDAFPPPVEFLVKMIDGWKIVHAPEGRRDFLLDRQDAYEAGKALFGPQPRDLLRPVPWPLLAESLEYLFPYIVTHFKNPVLMLCRIAYAWTHRSLCSKKGAGEWAAEAFGGQWSPLITTALEEYAQGVYKTTSTPEELHAFEDFCAGYIHTVLLRP